MDTPRRLCSFALIACLLGCTETSEQAARKSFELEQYASLPGLRATHHKELKAEFERLVSEQATPELLAAKARKISDAFEIRETRFNAREALRDVLPEPLHRRLESELERRYPQGEFKFNLRQFQAVEQMLTQFLEPAEEFRYLLERPNLEFPLDHTQGLATATDWVDALRDLARLEALTIAVQIEHGELPEAADSLILLFHGAEALSQIGHLVPRVSAVHMRRELLAVANAICHHPAVDRAIYDRLRNVIVGQLERWPPDAAAWIGERADGLHTYELIRDGYLLSVLSYKEIQQFRDEIGIKNLGELVIKNLDNDEFFYLRAMRAAIDSCDQPYYARRQLLRQLDEDIEHVRNDERYPIIADHVLLGDVKGGMRLQAVDRARLEAWRIALSIASGHEMVEVQNPLTGSSFVVDFRSNTVVVDGIDPADRDSAVQLTVLPPSNELSAVPGQADN